MSTTCASYSPSTWRTTTLPGRTVPSASSPRPKPTPGRRSRWTSPSTGSAASKSSADSPTSTTSPPYRPRAATEEHWSPPESYFRAPHHPVTTGIGVRPAIELARLLPAWTWQRISAGSGAKSPRRYDWAWIEATDPAVTEGGGPHWLLIRRRISDGQYAFYRAHAPAPVPLAQLVKVAGSRWKIGKRVRRQQGTHRPGR